MRLLLGFLLALVVGSAAWATPALDGSVANGFSGATSGAVSLTTTNTNDIVVVVVSIETTTAQGTPTVSSVTASGLTFTKRSSAATANSGATNNYRIETWWAPATSTLSSASITATISGTADTIVVAAFGVSGAASLASPFDSNASLPATATETSGSGGGAVYSTSQAHDLSFVGVIQANGFSFFLGSGWTQIQQFQKVNSSGQRQTTGYKAFTATQSNIQSFTAGNTLWYATISDAITSDAPPLAIRHRLINN